MKSFNLIMLSFIFAMPCSMTITNEKSQSDVEFLPYTTDKYTYNKDLILVGSTLGGNTEEVIADKTCSNSIFHNGISRIKITGYINKNMRSVTTETWTSRYPSYFTLPTIMLTSLIVASIYGIKLLFIDSKDTKSQENTSDNIN